MAKISCNKIAILTASFSTSPQTLRLQAALLCGKGKWVQNYHWLLYGMKSTTDLPTPCKRQKCETLNLELRKAVKNA